MTSRAVIAAPCVDTSASKPDESSRATCTAATATGTASGSSNNASNSNSTATNGDSTKTTALDFIAPNHAVKSLFSVPYATDKTITLAVHNVEGTLLIDEVDVSAEEEASYHSTRRSRRRSRPATFDQTIVLPTCDHNHITDNNHQQDPTLAMVTSMMQNATLSDGEKIPGSTHSSHNDDEIPDNDGNTNSKHDWMISQQPKDLTHILPPPEQYVSPSIPLPSIPKQYLPWKFQNLQVLVGSDAMIYGNQCRVLVAEAQELQALSRQHATRVERGEFHPDYELAQHEQCGKPSYAQVTHNNNDRATTTNTTSHASSFSAPDLNQVQLQTCIVPQMSNRQLPNSIFNSTPTTTTVSQQRLTSSTSSSKPICTVMDVYLENIMANVPQLALCLQEKGFIRNVRVLETRDIPSCLLQDSTLEMTDHFSIQKVDTTAQVAEPLFSPQVMEMNASTLLNFLQSNCTKNASTYLLRREAGCANIELYDITSISTQRQRKWKWWLATMSYRFALRLGHVLVSLEQQQQQQEDSTMQQQRLYRQRQRSLLQTTIDLLQDLADLDGDPHASLVAAACENLADTYLTTTTSNKDAIISVDALSKAHDYLNRGMKLLWPFLKKVDQNDDDDNDTCDSISIQLFSMHHKLIHVCLRLAEHHLNNYWSSSAMQALRTAARTIADGIQLLKKKRNNNDDDDDDRQEELKVSLRYQFIWLQERCGHFARSFAADDLWRERGHACGDDIICVLRDVEQVLASIDDESFNPNNWFNFCLDNAPLTDDTGGLVSLQELGAIVETNGSPTTIGQVQAAVQILDQEQKAIPRDKRRVLVAASVSYSRAMGALEEILRMEHQRTTTNGRDGTKNRKNGTNGTLASSSPTSTPPESNNFLNLLRQRYGDSCNEIGKILLTSLRQFMTDSSSDTATLTLLLCSAKFWFERGLVAFEACNDLRNLALLRCNLCQCWKLRANSMFASNGTSTHQEDCLDLACQHLLKAHEALGERDVDCMTWDMVSEELAATFLVLGVRRRQSALGGGTAPVVSLRLNPGQERDIVEPIEQALTIYQESNNKHQVAAAHYQLALFYARVWTCQRDETKTRQKLSAAFSHYAAAHAYFSSAPPGHESTMVLLSLDVANLYAAVSGHECLRKALSRCLDTRDCFALQAIEAAKSRKDSGQWLEKMSTLATSVEERVLKVLQALVKLEKDDGAGSLGYKDLYRTALTTKMSIRQHDATTATLDVKMTNCCQLLSTIRTEFQSSLLASYVPTTS